MADPQDSSDTGTIIADARDSFPDCPASATQPCKTAPKKPGRRVRQCVTKITATMPGTHGIRKVNKAVPERPDKELKLKGSDKAVVLIRGCKDVQLEATTTPSTATVQWRVEANHTANAPPAITADGNKATLKTNVNGSFSVIATLGGCKVVWNVIFVWVKVDTTSSKGSKATNHYADNGSTKPNFRFRSGEFSTGKYAWENQVNVTLLGGGDDQKGGVEKVNVQVLQNCTTDSLTAHYAPPPALSTALEKAPGDVPALDATDENSPFVTNSDAFKLLSGSKGDVNLTIWTGDSPASAFDREHQSTKKTLTSINGAYFFDTAIASFSDDAPNAIVVHAHSTWTADFSGIADAKGDYLPKGAKTTPTAPWTLISPDTGGQDAAEANMETMGQRFGDNLIPVFDWTP